MQKTHKTVRVRTIVIVLVLLILCAGACFGVYMFKSPQYALYKISRDIKDFGVEGLNPHLTGEAQTTVEKVSSIAESELLGSILSIFGKENYVSIIKSDLKEVEWTVNSISRSDKTADVSLGFDYKDELTGTMDIDMIYSDGEWKISAITMPEFDKVDLKS